MILSFGLYINQRTNMNTLSISRNTLKKINTHPRDVNVNFTEETHTYTIGDGSKKYTSTTTFIHTLFEQFNADKVITNMMMSKKWGSSKYYGKTREEIKLEWSSKAKRSSSDGSGLHYYIEMFMNQNVDNPTHLTLLEMYETQNREEFIDVYETKEWSYFLQFVSNFPDLKPYRTEWMIYDEECSIAGSIDMVYINDDGTLSIYDWKRCMSIDKTSGWNKYGIEECVSHLPDTNFWHYSLQLNIYKKILEKNYGVSIVKVVLVKLHPENKSNNFELIKLPFLHEEVKSLFEILEEWSNQSRI
jgi:ATP-dependent exoDNAse (exonuclease V) beta subunit